jgi:hypothetical protein
MHALLACASWIPVAASAAMSCESLKSLNLPNATVTLAQEVTSGTFTPPDGTAAVTGLPAFCRVAITVPQAIHIEVWLPKAAWNQRYQGVGIGGYGGSVPYADMGQALVGGYATAGTDTGHTSKAPVPVLDGSFALNPDGSLNWQLIEDFASRALHETALKAKGVISAFYGAPAKYSYWTGCSGGGRQALMSVQRFPEDYDGVLAGAPAINIDRFHPAELWPQIVMNQELGAPISNTKLNAVVSAAVAACDAVDGVLDGVINDPRKCHYDPAASICKTGDDLTKCLTTQEANVVRKVWNGPTDAKGKRLWFGLERGAALAPGPIALSGTPPFPITVDWFRYWIKQNAAFDWHTLKESDFEANFRLSQRKFNKVMGTDEDNLHPFRRAGGKVLIWHGEADLLIFPRGSINYYMRVLEEGGGIKHVDDFARLFMAPGVGHCRAGPGPNAFGQGGALSTPLKPDADHDMLRAVVRWVEQGVAPDRIIATKYVNDSAAQGVVRTRPLCAFPKTAKWTGVGSTNDAANFVCVDGNHDPNDFKVFGRGADNEGLAGGRKDDDGDDHHSGDHDDD